MSVTVDLTNPAYTASFLVELLSRTRLAYIQNVLPDSEKTQERKALFEIFDAVKKKLSSASPEELNKVKAYFEEQNALGGEAQENIQRVENSITLFYKNSFDALKKAAVTIADSIVDEHMAILEEYGDNTLDNPNTLTVSDIARNKIIYRNYVLNADPLGNTPQTQQVRTENKQATVIIPKGQENNRRAAAVHELWHSLEIPRQKNELSVSDEEESLSDTGSPEIRFSEFANQPLTWMDYREKTKAALECLSKDNARVLFYENSPLHIIWTAFKNFFVEMVTGAPTHEHDQHQKQQSWKEAIGRVRETTGFVENPVDQPEERPTGPSQ